MKCFSAKGYTLDHQIATDSVGCSILLKRKAPSGERVYMCRQITEARLLKLFGSGADTIVAIGDWSQRQHRRFKEPVKGKGFRTIFMFRKPGYDVYLVDEFRTSSRCSACEQGECETFRKCENP